MGNGSVNHLKGLAQATERQPSRRCILLRLGLRSRSVWWWRAWHVLSPSVAERDESVIECTQ